MKCMHIGSCSTHVLHDFEHHSAQAFRDHLRNRMHLAGEGKTYILVTHGINSAGSDAWKELRRLGWWKLWNKYYAERVAWVPATFGQIWIVTKRGIIF